MGVGVKALWAIRILFACRVSLLSVAAGALLFLISTQARDLFADIAFGALPGAAQAWLMWASFFAYLVFLWAFPVHYAARRLLQTDVWMVSGRLRDDVDAPWLADIRSELGGPSTGFPASWRWSRSPPSSSASGPPITSLRRLPALAPARAAAGQIAILATLDVVIGALFLVFLWRRKFLSRRMSDASANALAAVYVVVVTAFFDRRGGAAVPPSGPRPARRDRAGAVRRIRLPGNLARLARPQAFDADPDGYGRGRARRHRLQPPFQRCPDAAGATGRGCPAADRDRRRGPRLDGGQLRRARLSARRHRRVRRRGEPGRLRRRDRDRRPSRPGRRTARRKRPRARPGPAHLRHLRRLGRVVRRRDDPDRARRFARPRAGAAALPEADQRLVRRRSLGGALKLARLPAGARRRRLSDARLRRPRLARQLFAAGLCRRLAAVCRRPRRAYRAGVGAALRSCGEGRDPRLLGAGR